MRMANTLQYTENHRYFVYRDFSLSPLDERMLTAIYQPMVGPRSVALYLTLYRRLPAEQTGFSSLEQQRRLFLSMALDPGDKGRKELAGLCSRLEAVGLLQSSRLYMAEEDDYVYEYRLLAPLLPDEFFRNQHLTLLLRDKVGKFMVVDLRKAFLAEEPEELLLAERKAENLSVPFYELFRLNVQAVDEELEQALQEMAPARERAMPGDSATQGYSYAEIILRFPRESVNRRHVELLKDNPDQLAEINYAADKYQLTLQETVRLLDEEGVFDEDGRLRFDLLQHKANAFFRQTKKRDDDRSRHLQRGAAAVQTGTPEESLEPEEKQVAASHYLEVPSLFEGQCDIGQYNLMLRNEPYTRVLRRFFPNGSVPDRLLDIFERVDLNYGLNEEVINVLIHYFHTRKLSWTKPFIDSVVTDMLGKRVHTYEEAVDYIRAHQEEKTKGSAKGASGSASGRGKAPRKKPDIPVITGGTAGTKVTDEEYERIMQRARKLEERLK